MSDRLQQVQRAFATYMVERELGSGGMATVYLAHDIKHDRKVAIKVLHAELAAVLGADRFLQEIRVTANLQHPHILGLIDSGIAGEGELQGRPYYVMPYVKGESLRQRLDKEQQLPVSDAVRIATEVASALDYAHRQGVIHRDIKPENILLHDGSAIVADFGIALAVTQAGGARMTQTGLSLGTPSYMSPEQAMGERTITARSDIYSLGAVTYEMLSGEPPFTGPTVQAIVARVMTEDPRALSAQRRSLPSNVDAAVLRALEKVPADRFASAHEFAEALNNPAFAAAARAIKQRQPSGRLSQMLYGVTALAVVLAVTALRGWMRPAPPKLPVRYNLVFDSAEAIVHGGGFWGRLALSPDGSHLAYIGVPRGMLWIRPRNQLHATAVPGTEGANTPFFSPDGQRVGFVSARRVVQFVSIAGGAPSVVTDSLVGVAGASWGRDGFIYADGFGAASLVRVEAKPNASSGTTDLWIKQLDRGPGVKFTLDGQANSYPAWTPDGRSVTFTSNVQGAAILWTKRADGSSVPALQLKEKRGVIGATWSPDGKWLVYRTDRQGAGAGDIMGIRPGIDSAPVPLVATRFTEFSPTISPDGKWLAYASNEGGRYDIYVVPFPNTNAAKWIVSTLAGTEPLWSHRGTELFYRDGPGNMVAVEVKTKPVFSAGRSTVLFPETRFDAYEASPQYAVSPDDRRFLMIRAVAGSVPDKLVVVDNWFDELRSRAAK